MQPFLKTSDSVQPHQLTEEHTPAARQLDALYSITHGWVVLAWIDGDPRPNCGGIYDQEWYQWPRQRRALLHDAHQLAVRGMNVYVGLTLHSVRQRTYGSALDSPWLWLDDLKHIPDDASMALETSPGNYQVYWQIDQALNARTRAALQRRARAYYGVDTCSADAVHLVRLAGGRNRKRHGDFLVRLDHSVYGRPHPLATLESRWPVAANAIDLVDPVDIDLGVISHWNGNLPTLLNDQGLPRRWKNPRVPGWRVLRGELAAGDRSTQRFIVIKSLVLHGYPDAEITAIAAALTDYGHSKEKGSDWLYLDIARCIAKAERELACAGTLRRITPTRLACSTQPAPLPQVEPPRRRGRPPGSRAAKIAQLWRILVQRAEDDPSRRIYYSIDDLAETCRASRRSTQEYLAELEVAGRIQRGQDGRRNMGWIALCPDFVGVDRSASNALCDDLAEENPPVLSPASADFTLPTLGSTMWSAKNAPAHSTVVAPTAGRVADNLPNAPTHDAKIMSPASYTSVTSLHHVSKISITDTTPSADHELRDAKNMLAELPLNDPLWDANDFAEFVITMGQTASADIPRMEEHTSAGTTLTRPQLSPPSLRDAVAEAFAAYASALRLTCKRIAQHLATNYPALTCAPAALERTIAAERVQRAWAKQLATLTTQPYTALVRLSKKLDRVLANGRAGPERQQYGWACWLAPHVDAELARRAAMNERAAPTRVRAQRQEYMALAARASRGSGRTLLPPRMLCSPQHIGARASPQSPASAPLTDPTYDAVGLVARLRARLATVSEET